MPSENRVRLNDDECLFPVLPGSGRENPEEAIELPEFRSPTSSVQNGELLAEREVLECQLRAEPQGGVGRDDRGDFLQRFATQYLSFDGEAAPLVIGEQEALLTELLFEYLVLGV
jgi:hypothetical protein